MSLLDIIRLASCCMSLDLNAFGEVFHFSLYLSSFYRPRGLAGVLFYTFGLVSVPAVGARLCSVLVLSAPVWAWPGSFALSRMTHLHVSESSSGVLCTCPLLAGIQVTR